MAELVGRVRGALGGALPEAAAKMRLYLPNPATHAILFKPIKSNIAEAHGQARGRGGRGQGARGCLPCVPAPRAAPAGKWKAPAAVFPPSPSSSFLPTISVLYPTPFSLPPPHTQIAALLEAEYTPEEVASIGLTPPAELAALLDSLS